MQDFDGVYPVIATPFTGEGAVDLDAIRVIIEEQVDRGVDGIVCFGIAAEFYKLSDAERREIVDVAVEACAGTDTDCVVSVTDHATPLAVEFARYAETQGADGLMLLPPFFLDPSEDDLLAHMRTVGTAVDIPIVVQYAPEQTGVSIAPATLARLDREVEAITAFKIESQPPGPYLSDLHATLDDVTTLVGYAGLQLIEALDRGASGVIPSAALSDHYLDIVESYRAGDRMAAVRRHADLLPLLALTIQDIEMYIHYEKRLLQHRGLLEDLHPRDPSFSPDEVYDTRFREAFGLLEDSR